MATITVGALISQLKMHPENMAVVVDGYEDGYDDINSIFTIRIRRNVNDKWYYGEHAESKD